MNIWSGLTVQQQNDVALAVLAVLVVVLGGLSFAMPDDSFASWLFSTLTFMVLGVYFGFVLGRVGSK